MNKLNYSNLSEFDQISIIPREIKSKNFLKDFRQNFKLLKQFQKKFYKWQIKNMKFKNITWFNLTFNRWLKLLTFFLTITILSYSSIANARNLQQGDQGADVMALQKALQMQGFFPANQKVTEYYGNITQEAVKKFQQNNNLTPDGVAGDLTQLTLFEKISEEDAEALLNQNTNTNINTSQNNSTAVETQNNTSSVSDLKRGDQGAEVKKLQEVLKQQGYFPSLQNTTEFYGSITEGAVKKFQQSQGLTINGIADQATQQKLFSTTTETATTQNTSQQTITSENNFLKRGARGEKVKQLQQLLKDKGYFPQDTNITSYYGRITENSVKKFQQDHNLKADGVVGQNTWNKLINTTSTPTPQTPTSNTSESNQSTIDVSLKAQTDIDLCRRVSIPDDGYLVIRLYPSSNSEEVDVLSNNTKIGIKNTGNNGWVPLMEGGYVSSKYLKQC